jgi:putative adhesin
MLVRRLATFAITLVLATTAFAADDVIRKGFNVAPGGTLHLDADIGSIKIVCGGTGVAIEVVRNARGNKSAEVLSEHKIDFRQSGNDVVITSDFDNHWDRWFSNYDVQWNIRVPAQYNVDVKTSGGSIDLADIGGTVDAKTSGGSIRTGRVSGPAKLSTSGGSITVIGANGELIAHTSGGGIEIGDTAGRVEARTSGGSIKLAHVGGEVLARTSGGGIRIEGAKGRVDASTSGGSITATLSSQPAGDSRLSTSGGGVTVNLASGIGVELDAKASGGGVHSDVPITVQGTQDDDSLQGRINGGGPKLVLRSSGGGIRVRSL